MRKLTIRIEQNNHDFAMMDAVQGNSEKRNEAYNVRRVSIEGVDAAMRHQGKSLTKGEFYGDI